MRFNFFARFRRPSSLKDTAKVKMSKLCCLHSPTEGFDRTDEDLAIVEEAQSRKNSKTFQNSNKTITAQPLRCSLSRSSQTSVTSSICPLEAVVVSDVKEDTDVQENQALQEFCQQFGFTASPNVAKDEHHNEKYWKERGQSGDNSTSSNSPSYCGSSERSCRRGPGLGSVSDNPPSRMQMESSTHDMGNILQSRTQGRRGDGAGAHAPDLLTRLEVCSGSCRGENKQPAPFDSAANVRSERLGSYPVLEPMTPNDSLRSASSRSQSPAVKTVLGGRFQFENEMSTHGLSRMSSPSVDLGSVHSTDSTTKGASPEHPTTLIADTQLDFQKIMKEKGGNNVHASKIPDPDFEEQQSEVQPDPRDHYMNCGLNEGASKLWKWNVRLRLDWISHNSNDLVAEVFPREETSTEDAPGPSIRANPAINRNRLTYGEENSSNEMDIDGLHRNIETEVVQIVHRVLCELKKRRRSKSRSLTNSRRLGLPLVQEVARREAERDMRTQQRKLSSVIQGLRQPSVSFPGQIEITPHFQQRLEVLNAFELLVSRMEDRLHFSEHEETTTLETRLSEAILCDLRTEIVRLTEELHDLLIQNAQSTSEKSHSQLCNDPRQHKYSFSVGNSTGAAEFPNGIGLGRESRPHSAFAKSSQQMVATPKEFVHRSAPEPSQATSSHHLHDPVKRRSQIEHLKENINKMALFTEENE